MGMFDSFFVHQLGPSLDFQTKDLECELAIYKVTETGEIFKRFDWVGGDEVDGKPVPDLDNSNVVIYDYRGAGSAPRYFKLHIRAGKCIRIHKQKEAKNFNDWKLIWPKPPE